jgi:membrane protein YqaA with SNARE-associated domain
MSESTHTAKRSFLRGLYDWTMANASGRHAWAALFAVSFAESSFLPDCARCDALPMVLADRKRAFLLAAWCTFASCWAACSAMPSARCFTIRSGAG